jgi:hypothetical protein
MGLEYLRKDYFCFPNSFKVPETSNDLNIITQMGLEHLSKTHVFGNNPRMLSKISADEVKIYLSGLSDALSNSSFADYVRKLVSTKGWGDQCVDVAIHQFFFMKPTDHYKGFSLVPVSNYMLCFINRYINCMNVEQASYNYNNSINNAALRRIYFETYFHTYILKPQSQCEINITYKYQLDKDGFQFESHKKKTKYSFKVSKCIRADTVNFFDLVNGEFFCPKIFNFSTFGSVFKGFVRKGKSKQNKEIVFFFQYTLENQHEIKGKNYSIIENCLNLKSVKEVNLIFIVPNAEIEFKPYINEGSMINFDRHINVYLGSFPMSPYLSYF